ncbi:MAG: LysM peptidoglycan-binding domain-containing protein [Accumulibacter sp.]|uniref:LysM peptidoglycan-binding domain-containing protein n=1 Tax=Accumulibacter sp. TaxID=2053492 RepID=UPI002FC32E7F
MTPRIAFAIAFALTCGAASSDEATNLASIHQAPPSAGSPQAGTAAWQLDPEGVLPVIELPASKPLAETIDLTAQPEEIFHRMRQGFSMPNLNSPLVLHHQQWYLNHPEALRRMVERSSRYLHHIVEEIDKRGMPMELALLPMVESAYNPTAYSRSHASGLWQFVPATGRQYKLEQNWWVDERRDIVASTTAALDYLQYIYDLHGDWHLALASYNWGEGAVGKAINRNRANGLPTDYLNLTMPEETRHYVPKLQALKNVFSNPNILANLNIRGVPNRPYFTTVTKTANIDVKLAAQLAEMPVKEFVALNPAHNRPVIKSETPMVIPADKVDTFISNLEAHEESEKPLSSWQAYTLRAGDRLEEVAPRFGMTVANLKAVNGINGRIRLAPGLTLLVAGQEGADPADLAGLPEQPKVAEQPRLAPSEPAPVAVTRTHTHTVQKGETLLKVAQRYDMSMAELKQLNKLRGDQVNAGVKLAVAAPEHNGKPAAAGAPTALAAGDSKRTEARAEPTPLAATRSHTVGKGETLAQVASRYDMSVAELKQLNKLRGDQVNAGVKLAVAAPEHNGKPAAAGAPTALAAVDSKRAEARAEPTPLAATRSHTVGKGETLAQVANRYDMSVAELKQLNKLRGDQVNAGVKLAVAAPEHNGKPAAGGAHTALAAIDSKRTEARAEPTPLAATRSHTVSKGETLAQVASRYDMSVAELKQLNKLRGDQVNAGVKLAVAAPEPVSKLPAGKSRIDAAEVESRQGKADSRQTLAKAEARTGKKAEDSSDISRHASRKQARQAQYTIRRGDTLVSIARQFRVEKDDLLRWNRIQGNEIKPGQTLTIQLVQNML